MKSTILAAALAAAAALTSACAFAGPAGYFSETTAKADIPGVAQQAAICPAGQAWTYTVQCDPGSRPPAQRGVFSQGAGVEICRVKSYGCSQLPSGLNPQARPGFEVMDSGGGSLVSVTFGVGQLLGLEPF